MLQRHTVLCQCIMDLGRVDPVSLSRCWLYTAILSFILVLIRYSGRKTPVAYTLEELMLKSWSVTHGLITHTPLTGPGYSIRVSLTVTR
jgi:hypothetical protein